MKKNNIEFDKEMADAMEEFREKLKANNDPHYKTNSFLLKKAVLIANQMYDYEKF